jgi:hypothetical protein
MREFAVPRPRVPVRTLPKVSFGPYGLLEAVPWLMLASAMRFVAFSQPALALPCYMVSNLSIFLAFLLAARRMIELADGATQLGNLVFGDQIRLAVKVLLRVVLLLIAASILVAVTGPSELAVHMLIGFDGIAFDQFSKLGMLWSACLATLVLLMVIRAGDDGAITLATAGAEFSQRALYLLPAILLLTGLLIGLSEIQATVRGLVLVFDNTSSAPRQVKNLVYFFFVFGFASLRLWLSLAVLVFALRESYRRQPA